jgi:VWFA-related protein
MKCEVSEMSTFRSGWIPVFCVAAASGFAQQSGPAGSTDRRTTLDVVVTDKSGKPISGLQQQDFTLLDNKQAQKILSFRAVEGTTADPPVEVILLIDAVNTTFTAVASERDQIERFLGRNGGQLPRPVSMAFFADSGITFSNAPSQDGSVLIADLRQKSLGLRTINRSQGVYGAGDRLQLSLNALQQVVSYGAPRPGRKLVVWISPGWPILSGSAIELTPKQRQWVFDTVIGVSNVLRLARITLYSIDPLGMADAEGYQTFAYTEYSKAVKKPDQAQNGNLALQVLTSQSGGRVINSSNDVASEIAGCVADANAFYVLSFDTLPGDGPNEYHALDVKIAKRGLTARTRSGYYAQPEHR